MEALLWNHFNTAHKWIHDKLTRISEQHKIVNDDSNKKQELLEKAQLAAKNYIDDVGKELKDMLLKKNQNAIIHGLQIFNGLINLVRFFADSFGFLLREYVAYVATLGEEYIQAIRPPPRIDWSKLKKNEVEKYAHDTGYNLQLPDVCFKIIRSASAVLWLIHFLWMSRCTLLQAQAKLNIYTKHGGTVTKRKHYGSDGQNQSAAAATAAKRNRQSDEEK